MLFDPAQALNHQSIPPGTILTIQGRPNRALILLHSGLAELLAFSGEELPIRPEQIMEQSHRVGLLKGESVCGVSSFTRDEPEQWSIRTVSECIISSTPVESQELLETFQKNMALNLQVLRALRQRIDSALFLAKNYRYLWHKLASIADSIALALPPQALGDARAFESPQEPPQPEEEPQSPGTVHGGQSPDQPEKPTREASPLGEYAAYLQGRARALGSVNLEPWDANLFLDRVQEALELYGDLDDHPVENIIDYPQYLFLKRLIAKDDKTLAGIFSQDEPSNFYVFQLLSQYLATLLTANRDLVQAILDLTSRLYGPRGWVLELDHYGFMPSGSGTPPGVAAEGPPAGDQSGPGTASGTGQEITSRTASGTGPGASGAGSMAGSESGSSGSPDGPNAPRAAGGAGTSSPGGLSYSRFLTYLQRFSWRCRVDGLKLLGRDISRDYPGFKHLTSRTASAGASGTELRTGAGAPGAGAPGARAGAVAGESGGGTSDRLGRLDKYNGLLAQLLGFAEMGNDFNREFTELIQRLAGMEDVFISTKEAQQLRSQISSRYWKLYERCFLKVIDSDLKGFVPGIMLHLGLVDETLVTREELTELDALYSQVLSLEQPVPVMTLPYFLEKIYTGTVQPSITEMGEGFAETLRKQKKQPQGKRGKQKEYHDTPEDRVRWELSLIAPQLSRLLAGGRNHALPVLCSQSLQGGRISGLFQDPHSLSSRIEAVHQRDFTLFHRETVCRHHFGSDLVKKSVAPNIVLYPGAGSRMMMWQEIDGTRKDTPGRIMVPAFFSGQADQAITHVLAHLRWELSRVVAGPNWMDAVEGGLSGAYYDYLAFYKKNPHLSSAHKEKIKDFIGKTRTERERFALDYYTWVMHEYEDKVRLNPVARDIFYRFCPFPKERRQEMAKRPLFSDLDMKYNNRTRKEILKLESRFKRFEKAEKPVPEDMQAYMDYLTG